MGGSVAIARQASALRHSPGLRFLRKPVLELAELLPLALQTYFITVSVKIAIDFTPPARLRSMASIAAM